MILLMRIVSGGLKLLVWLLPCSSILELSLLVAKEGRDVERLRGEKKCIFVFLLCVDLDMFCITNHEEHF